MNTDNPTAVSPPHRFRCGKRKKPRSRYQEKARANVRATEFEKDNRRPQTLWKRIDQGLDWMIRLGLDPELATPVGKLYALEVLTKMQVQAANYYSEVAGRYSRYFIEGRRNAASPSFQRSFRGHDNEVQRHIDNGTITAYERKATYAKSQWARMLKWVPDREARAIMDQICLDNLDIPSSYHGDLKRILDNIAKEFFGNPK